MFRRANINPRGLSPRYSVFAAWVVGTQPTSGAKSTRPQRWLVKNRQCTQTLNERHRLIVLLWGLAMGFARVGNHLQPIQPHIAKERRPIILEHIPPNSPSQIDGEPRYRLPSGLLRRRQIHIGKALRGQRPQKA